MKNLARPHIKQEDFSVVWARMVRLAYDKEQK